MIRKKKVHISRQMEIEYKNTGNQKKKCSVPKSKPCMRTHCLFDLLRLELDRFSVDEDTLALVRLRPSPFANLSRKLCDHSLVHTLQENAGRLGCASLNSRRNTDFDGMRESDL